MHTTIRITSKGQTTVPVNIRKKLGISNSGGSLDLSFDDKNQVAILSKPLAIEELSRQISSFIKPGTKPVVSVDEYYQKYKKIS